MNFVTKAIAAGGSIHPLIVPTSLGTTGTALFNPSVYNDNGNLLVNVRHCQYALWHSERRKYEHQWGPLNYLCPEDDLTLTTVNYLCALNDDLTVRGIHRVDTSKLDVKPIWEFVGLEDARVVRWNNQLLYFGVRRDTTTNGVGRMEMSTIDYNGISAREVERWRIPAPGANNTYCEKNWVPIVDMPFHFIKWSNPTEVVRIDPVAKTCTTVFLGKPVQLPYDYRGGSHVIPFGEYRITIAHLLTKFNKSEAGRKDAQYRHAFIVWDRDWNVVKYGEVFDFMGAEIEFCCGLTEYKGNYLVSFGFQDNAAFVVHVPKKVIEGYVYG